MQSVLSELLCASNVLAIIQVDEMVARMLVENTFQSICSLLQELLPLGLKELEALSCDYASIFLLQIPCCGNTLVELWISYFSCNCDFDRSFRYHILNFNSNLNNLSHF